MRAKSEGYIVKVASREYQGKAYYDVLFMANGSEQMTQIPLGRNASPDQFVVGQVILEVSLKRWFDESTRKYVWRIWAEGCERNVVD